MASWPQNGIFHFAITIFIQYLPINLSGLLADICNSSDIIAFSYIYRVVCLSIYLMIFVFPLFCPFTLLCKKFPVSVRLYGGLDSSDLR
jgi:hypothetical protein